MCHKLAIWPNINTLRLFARTFSSNVDVKTVLSIGSFDLNRTLEMDPEFLNTDGEHVHDQRVTSVGISVAEDVDLPALQTWFSAILRDKGADMFRMKGVLAVAHAEQRFVYQAVHMLCQGDFTDPWGADEARGCKLTFIGKNIDHAELREGFMACLATPERIAVRLASLRFKVGDVVECQTGEWSKGKVVQLMYRDSSSLRGTTPRTRLSW